MDCLVIVHAYTTLHVIAFLLVLSLFLGVGLHQADGETVLAMRSGHHATSSPVVCS